MATKKTKAKGKKKAKAKQAAPERVPTCFEDSKNPDGTYRTPKAASRLVMSLTTDHLAALADADDGGDVDPHEDGASRPFAGQANSGQVFPHFWYGQLALDMDGLEVPSQVQPVLLDHATDKILGQTESIEVAEDKSLQARGKIHTVTEHGRDVVKLMEKGVPYQMSVYIPPSAVEFVEAGASAEVNGHTMNGPGAIYRQSTLREVTITALGADPNTQAALLSRGPKGELEFEDLQLEVSHLSHSTQECEAMDEKPETVETDHKYTQAEVDAMVAEAITAERHRLGQIDQLVEGTGMAAEDVAKFKNDGTPLGDVAIAAAQFMKGSQQSVLTAITERDKFQNDEGDADIDASGQRPNGREVDDKLTVDKVEAMELGPERFTAEFEVDYQNCRSEFAELDDYVAYREHEAEVAQRA